MKTLLTQEIASALRQEFGNLPSSMKVVAHITHANERAVRNWFDGRNGPSGENLIVLMRHSDVVLKVVLSLADRKDLMVAFEIEGFRRQLVETLATIDGLPKSIK
ncbi:MAG: hypothetical protein K2P80_11385 [Beijerinckiaceae bacterium]|nr:hypothetical protein [Beijerinckiaceae bacterium]